jgi:hypothetical protein
MTFSMADCDIGGYTVPSGTRTIINMWALGRDPSYWEHADESIPHWVWPRRAVVERRSSVMALARCSGRGAVSGGG